jgi:hypothetical protein
MKIKREEINYYEMTFIMSNHEMDDFIDMLNYVGNLRSSIDVKASGVGRTALEILEEMDKN